MPKISELPPAGAVFPTDQLEANQAGVSHRITVAQVAATIGTDFLPLAGGTLTGALTGTTATFSGLVEIASTGIADLEISGTTGALIDLKSPSSDDFDLRLLTDGTDSQINSVGALAIISPSVALSGALTGTTATFSADVSATEYQFNNVPVVKQYFAGFTGIGDPVNGVGGLHVSADNIYHHCPVHTFQGAGGTPTFAAFASSGAVLSVPLTGTTATFSGAVKALSATAVGAGAATQAFVKASSTADLGIYYGTGAPTFAAAKGSLYSNTAATTTTTRLYVNTSGSTTWANLTTSA